MASIRTHYLDASAIVKLLVREAGSAALCAYLDQHTAFSPTALCFAGTLGALKAKLLRNSLGQEEYLSACEELMAYFRNQTIEIDDIGISQRRTFDEVEYLSKKYSLDVSDSYQLVTLQRGLYSPLQGDSKPILVTADEALAKAARSEGLRTWDCLREPAP